MDKAHLSKVVKDAIKTGKYSLGAKESISGMKGSKALLLTKSVPKVLDAKLREGATKHNVTVLDLPMTSAEMAKMLGKPYNVSAVALRSVSEADIKQIQK